MKKIRSNYSNEFINSYTEDFLSHLPMPDHLARIREQINEVREHNYDALFLEMYFAVLHVQHQDALLAIKKLKEVMKHDELLIEICAEENRLAHLIIEFDAKKPSEIAKKGGIGRAAKFKKLEAETIKLYNAGNWKSLPEAALAITPKIVALSKNCNGDLSPTTTKPLEWIRAYVKTQKSNLS